MTRAEVMQKLHDIFDDRIELELEKFFDDHGYKT
jgi:hypothetical protein